MFDLEKWRIRYSDIILSVLLPSVGEMGENVHARKIPIASVLFRQWEKMGENVDALKTPILSALLPSVGKNGVATMMRRKPAFRRVVSVLFDLFSWCV